MSVNNRHHLRLTLSKLVLIIARHSSLNFSLKVSGLLNPSRLAVSHKETGGSSFIIVFNFSSILRRDCSFLYSARFEDIERHKSGNLPRKASPLLKFKLQAISGAGVGIGHSTHRCCNLAPRSIFIEVERLMEITINATILDNVAAAIQNGSTTPLPRRLLELAAIKAHEADLITEHEVMEMLGFE